MHCDPVTRAERISSMDVLRGFSLMGILVMNICDFAYGFTNYAFPLSTVKPVFNGGGAQSRFAIYLPGLSPRHHPAPLPSFIEPHP